MIGIPTIPLDSSSNFSSRFSSNRSLPDLGALGFEEHRIERLAGRHEKSIALRSAETEIRADLGQMEIVVPLACELQVDLGQQSGRADGLRVLDEDGVTLPLYECFGSFIAECAEAEIAEGRSSVLSTDERAHTLVLLLRGKEVARLPLALTTGETTIVRP